MNYLAPTSQPGLYSGWCLPPKNRSLARASAKNKFAQNSWHSVRPGGQNFWVGLAWEYLEYLRDYCQRPSMACTLSCSFVCISMYFYQHCWAFSPSDGWSSGEGRLCLSGFCILIGWLVGLIGRAFSFFFKGAPWKTIWRSRRGTNFPSLRFDLWNIFLNSRFLFCCGSNFRWNWKK